MFPSISIHLTSHILFLILLHLKSPQGKHREKPGREEKENTEAMHLKVMEVAKK